MLQLTKLVFTNVMIVPIVNYLKGFELHAFKLISLFSIQKGRVNKGIPFFIIISKGLIMSTSFSGLNCYFFFSGKK